MNPKIEKLKAERSRNTEKISDLQNRNRKLSEQITKLENNDIIGMVREIGMTPEQLAALLSGRTAEYLFLCFPGQRQTGRPDLL